MSHEQTASCAQYLLVGGIHWKHHVTLSAVCFPTDKVTHTTNLYHADDAGSERGTAFF